MSYIVCIKLCIYHTILFLAEHLYMFRIDIERTLAA